MDARKYLAELVGTFILVVIGSMSIVAAGAMSAPVLVVVPFGFGLGLLAAIQSAGYVSGGHFNPAVTLGALLDRRIDAMNAIGYVVAQVIGAIAASGAVLLVANQAAVKSTASAFPADKGINAFAVEVLLTAIFVARHPDRHEARPEPRRVRDPADAHGHPLRRHPVQRRLGQPGAIACAGSRRRHARRRHHRLDRRTALGAVDRLGHLPGAGGRVHALRRPRRRGPAPAQRSGANRHATASRHGATTLGASGMSCVAPSPEWNRSSSSIGRAPRPRRGDDHHPVRHGRAPSSRSTCPDSPTAGRSPRPPRGREQERLTAGVRRSGSVCLDDEDDDRGSDVTARSDGPPLAGAPAIERHRRRRRRRGQIALGPSIARPASGSRDAGLHHPPSSWAERPAATGRPRPASRPRPDRRRRRTAAAPRPGSGRTRTGSADGTGSRSGCARRRASRRRGSSASRASPASAGRATARPRRGPGCTGCAASG